MLLGIVNWIQIRDLASNGGQKIMWVLTIRVEINDKLNDKAFRKWCWLVR
jgi:hypothetical protein